VTRSAEELVAAGREALERHAWQDAYDALSEADRAGSLPGEGLEMLAWASYWTGHPDETVEAIERAYRAYLDEGNERSAAMMALRVAEQHGMRMNLAQAQGWGAKATRHADGHPDWPVVGWLAWMQGLVAWFEGDFDRAVASYDDALAFAARSGDRELHAMSLHDKGHALCLLGRPRDGWALIDEAMTAVVGGELEPAAAGYVYCGTISACSRLGDYRRASEWTDATLRWCERQSVPGFPGVCRVHKAELMRVRGSFAQAEREARIACEELPRYAFFSELGPANYEIGEVRRRMGDVHAAEESFSRAHEHGLDPQPGLSLLRLAQGNVDAAVAGIGRAVATAGGNRCHQARLLATQVEIAAAAGDLATAGSAADRLDTIVADYESVSLQAMAAGARGSLLLAQGEAEEAVGFLRRAHRGWQEVEAPHEVAEARLLLAEAQRAVGDPDAALMEARAARDTFERLGARPGAERAAALLGELAPSERPERVGRSFMFTDIVKSTDLLAAIGDEAWENLLAWHDQTLRSLFATHGGDVAHHTGDGFFVAFADRVSAVRCAVAIQRALADHRRTHGFALQVRIGLHAGEGTRRGQDYSGGEVHKAARIAALGQGGEILASDEALEGTDGVATSEARDVTLKGFPEPVAIRRVEWR
jgi:class 3 adenylate cyclase